MEGEEGVGKGYFAIWCVVQIVKGLWGEKAPCLYLTSEEEPWVIQERCRAAGWDPDVDAAIHVLRINGGDSIVQLPFDYVAMTAYIKQFGYGMVVVDVLRDHCAPTKEMGITQRSNNDETWIRPAAGAWERLACETGITVLGLHHRNKSEGGSSRSKSTGSGAWRQRARLVIVLVEVAGDHALAVDKQNIGRRARCIWPFDLIEVTEDYGRFELGEVDASYETIDQWEKARRKDAEAPLQMDPVDTLKCWCETRLEELGEAVIDLRLPKQRDLAKEVGLSQEKTKKAVFDLTEQGYMAVRRVGRGDVTFFHRNGHGK